MTYLNFFAAHGRRKNVVVFFVLAFLWLFFLWRAFAPAGSFALFMDNEFFIGTVFSAMSHSFANGEWPLRIDTVLGGMPLYNFAQLSPFYPFYLSGLPLFNTPIDAIESMHWLVLGHLLIFEINMYVLLRVIGVSRIAAITGAALVAFSANSFSYAVWVNITAPYAWLPLYMAGIVGVLKNPTSKSFAGVAFSGILLLTLASPSQPLIHAVFVTAVFVFFFWRDQRTWEEISLTRSAVKQVVGIGLLALLILAPVLLPTALDFKNMIRWIGPFPAVSGNDRIPFDAFQIGQLSVPELGGVLFKFKDAAVGSQFVGVVTLALALVSLTLRSKSWMVLSLAFIALYSLISATGANLGLAYINYYIPILNKIREPSRFLVLFQLAIGILAAIGLDGLCKAVVSYEDRTLIKRILLLLLAVALFALAINYFLAQRIVSNVPSYISIGALVFLTAVSWYVFHSRLRIAYSLFALLWSGVALALLSVEIPWMPPAVAGSQYLTSGAIGLDQVLQRVAAVDPEHDYRVIFEGKIDRQQAAMLASYRGIRTFNSYFNPAPRHQFEEMYYHGARPDNYFRILGAKYLICQECKSDVLSGYKHLEDIAGYQLYEAEDVLPHSYIAHRLDGTFTNLGEFLGKVANIDLRKGLLLVDPSVVAGLGANDVPSDTCVSRQDIRKINLTRYIVQCKSSGVLVFNEFHDAAWKASVDGVASPALKVNGNQIGIAFPSGGHVIELRYRPTVFLVSLAIGFVGVLILIFVIVVARSNKPSLN